MFTRVGEHMRGQMKIGKGSVHAAVETFIEGLRDKSTGGYY